MRRTIRGAIESAHAHETPLHLAHHLVDTDSHITRRHSKGGTMISIGHITNTMRKFCSITAPLVAGVICG